MPAKKRATPTRTPTWRLTLLAALMGVAAAVVVIVMRPHASAPPAPATQALPAVSEPAPVARPAPTFVGTEACAGCHRAEADAWAGSQHAHAMQPATPAAVLGDFADARYEHDGVTSTFFRKGDRYFVRTDGPDGALADFEIAYTFGVYPLQQYLIPFPDGRLQALSIAWDARPREAGGGRWFHLYPNEHIDHRDPLHWTRLQQNWNYVCADCHSTNLRRNYDAAHDRYATTWSEVDVACESCHGAGSDHVAWAEKRPGFEHAPHQGLTIALDERRDVAWTPTVDGNAERSRPRDSHREVDTCAVCHARRVPLGVDPGPTGDLLETHAPSLLEARLYHPDGQQRDEVYTWGSFVQSKMYAKGVTCSDCHDPHTLAVRAPGNALCARCHAAATYDTPAHLLHAPGSPGASCVACHMPTRTYMLIDPRHDHSLRVPRPDLTVRYGVPNACSSCHADKDAKWAAAAIEKAHGPERKGFQTWVDTLDAARRGAPGAREELVALATDASAPAIARATAVAELARFPAPSTVAAIKPALTDRDPLVRAAAVDALDWVPPAPRAELVEPLAADPEKLVRVRAGRALSGAALGTMSPARRAPVERALAEYVASEDAMAERPESHLNLGTFYAERNDPTRAEAEYRAAIARQPDFAPAYANLADLYRALGRDEAAAGVLAQGLDALPDEPNLLHALGLARVRAHRVDDAVPLLARAAAAQPDNPRYAYVYAVALDSVGRRDDAIAILGKALERSPYDPELLLALTTYNRDAGRIPTARAYAQRLVDATPDDPDARRLLESLGDRPASR